MNFCGYFKQPCLCTSVVGCSVRREFSGSRRELFPKSGARVEPGPEGHSHRTTALCCCLASKRLACIWWGLSAVQRTVWPVRNVVPTTAPIYPHKFSSKLTILTQARLCGGSHPPLCKGFFYHAMQNPHWINALPSIVTIHTCINPI